MANSLTGNWQAHLRRLRKTQTRTARQLQSWLGPLGLLDPSVEPRRAPPLPPDTADTPDSHPGPLPGAWQTHHLKLAPQRGELIAQLSYRLYVPLAARSRPLPVVVMLHGCRQSPEELAAGTRMNALAEREGFIVAYPRQPLHRQPMRCWHWFDLAAGEGGREVQAIATLLDELAARPDVRQGEIYIAGMSAGAAMAAVVGLRYPGKVAAVGLHSGVVIGAADSPRSGLHAMRDGSAADPAWLLDAAGVTPGGPEMPAIIVHGLADDAVNPINARLLARQFLAYNRLSAPASLSGPAMDGGESGALPSGEYLRARYGRWNQEVVTLVEVAGLDHAWSGGDPDYGYHSPVGPDASHLMWEFFRRHQRGTVEA